MVTGRQNVRPHMARFMRKRGVWRFSALLGLGLAVLAALPLPGVAQDEGVEGPTYDPNLVSSCLLIADNQHFGPRRALARSSARPPVLLASAGEAPRLVNDDRFSVEISFVGHSTFRIKTPDGVVAATDYAGFAGVNVVPDLVTMNRAHSSHFTDSPDPRIAHVLRGWNPEGGPARHKLMVGDLLVRNVATDIRSDFSGYVPDGNSIFIFEAAGLCIGHLGHLHHRLDDNHFSRIGRLDILMVPVDGSYTMDEREMAEIAKRVRASIVLTMHAFGPVSLESFLANMQPAFNILRLSEPRFTVSLNSLPNTPTVMVLPRGG